MSATLKQNDILHENVTGELFPRGEELGAYLILRAVIENITRNREPQALDAIYIIMPTTQNVERVISDFTGNRAQYSAAHLYFVERMLLRLFRSRSQLSSKPLRTS
jgi:syntaxin-binding protein 1